MRKSAIRPESQASRSKPGDVLRWRGLSYFDPIDHHRASSVGQSVDSTGVSEDQHGFRAMSVPDLVMSSADLARLSELTRLLADQLAVPGARHPSAYPNWGTHLDWGTHLGSTRIEVSPPKELLLTVTETVSAIVQVLRFRRLDIIADRIEYLQSLVDDDPDEEPIVVESLRNLAGFFMDEDPLPTPQIGISPGGLLMVEWDISKHGALALKFLRSGLIQFAGVTDNRLRKDQCVRSSGTFGKTDLMNAIKPFTSRLT